MLNFTLILLFFSGCFCYPNTVFNGFQIEDLRTKNMASMQKEALDWTVVGAIGSSVTSACPSDPALGGYQIINYGGYFKRVFDSLPSHNIIYFRMRFGVIDDWRSGDTINVFFDSTSMTPGDLSIDRAYFSSNLCGNSGYKDDDSIFMIGKVFHTASSLTFKAKSNILSAVNQNSAHFSIRKISLLFANKTAGETEGSCIHADYTSADKYCGCGQGSYPNPSNPAQCLTCNAACTDCFGPSANECYACSASGYSWDGAKCFKCATGCLDCFGPGANQCLRCSSTYWHNPDFTCTSTCASPNQATIGEIKICKNSCSGATPYKLYNSTCAATCDSPLVSRTTNFGLYCDWPCASSTDYLYWNNSCISSCNSPYVVVSQSGKDTCQLPCSANNYLYPNGSCISTCSLPEFTIRNRSSVLYCNETCNYASGQYLNWTGLCVGSCALPSYIRTVNTSIKYCDACQPGYFMYSHNVSCLSTCPSPFSSRTVNGSSFCDMPCASNLFTYQNGSCKATCDFPYTGTTTPGYKFCNKPCSNSLDFVHQNGTCSSTCSSPAIQTSFDSIKVCSKPCSTSSDYYYSWNSTCHSSCSSPAVQKTWETILICSKPCPTSSDYFYSWNSTCHSSCSYRIGQDPDYGINLCLPPCVNPSDYFYPENNTCISNCPAPYNQITSPFNICQKSSSNTTTTPPSTLTNLTNDYVAISSSISTYSTPAMALLSSSNFGAFGLRGFVKMLPYLRYMEIDYPKGESDSAENGFLRTLQLLQLETMKNSSLIFS